MYMIINRATLRLKYFSIYIHIIFPKDKLACMGHLIKLQVIIFSTIM